MAYYSNTGNPLTITNYPVLPRSRVNGVLTELHGGQLGSHVGVNKPLNKVPQRYTCLQTRNDAEK
jgi:hypothetical protein